MNDEFFKKISGVPALGGEQAFPPVERIGARPTWM